MTVREVLKKLATDRWFLVRQKQGWRMNKARYLVRIFAHEGDYSAMVPDLPGCIAAGGSVEEVHKLIAEAVGLHLELMRQSGESIPEPTNPVDLHLDDLEEGELCTWVESAVPEVVSK